MEWLFVVALLVCAGTFIFALHIINKTFEKARRRDQQWADICARNTNALWARLNDTQKVFAEREKHSAAWIQHLMHELARLAAAGGEEAIIKVDRLFKQMEVQLATCFADAIRRGAIVFDEERKKAKEAK